MVFRYTQRDAKKNSSIRPNWPLGSQVELIRSRLAGMPSINDELNITDATATIDALQMVAVRWIMMKIAAVLAMYALFSDSK